MSALDQLYQQVILDHYKDKHGYGLRDGGGAAGESSQYNPLCGDEVTVRVDLSGLDDGTPVVQDISWEGNGCSISQASTSVLHEQLTGQSLGEAEKVVAAFREMIRSRGTDPGDEDVLGDGVAFAGVGRHANRVKCAMLGWTAFEAAVLAARVAVADDATSEGSTSEEQQA